MIYFGVVENVKDPLNSGRVQVRVYPFYKDFATKDLPWAYVERSTDLGQTRGRGLNQHNLIEGSQVTVEFLDDQMQQPIVRGVVPRESDFENLQSFVVHTIKFLNGSEITVDETPGAEYVKVIDPNRNFILMSTTGITIHVGDAAKKIQIEGAGIVNVTAGGDLNVSTSANATVKSSGNLSVSTSGNTTISTEGDTKITTSGNTDIKSSGQTTVEGSKLNLKNILGKNQLCALPACLFTGTPHISPNSD